MNQEEADRFMLALTVWRENRGGGNDGMHSVANVIMNRAQTRHTSAYVECVRPWQFSSITAKGDSQLILYPAPGDAQWQSAQSISGLALSGQLNDLTGGATSYYALSMTTPPKWAAEMTKTVEFAGHIFFK